MALGMHPAIFYPRRSRVAPIWSARPADIMRPPANPHCTPLPPAGQLVADVQLAPISVLDVRTPGAHNPNTLSRLRMNFEEQLQRCFETVSNRLRADISQHFQVA